MGSIVGFWQIGNRDKRAGWKKTALKFWRDETRGVVLGNETAEPVVSDCGRYVIAFGGELYNGREVAEELKDETLTNASFERVVLGAILKWGLEKALKQINGVFSLILWDAREERIFFARDKAGVGAFYYGAQNGTLFFSSNLTSLRTNELFNAELDRDVLSSFFRFAYVPVPHSIYKGINKLEAGSFISVDKELNLKKHTYWDALKITEEGRREFFGKNEDDAARELERLLKRAIVRRTESGKTSVFLSGGIDSSLITALASAERAGEVRTFSMALNEASYNEAMDAREISKHLGTHHTEFLVTPEKALEVIPKLADIYDEPFSDSSQIPTYLLLAFAGGEVRTGLSGDGGDEIFGGYNRYLWADKVWKKAKKMPYGARGMFARAIKKIPPETWDKIADKFSKKYPALFNHRMFGDKAHKLADAVKSRSEDEMYLSLASHWREPEKLVLGSTEPKIALDLSNIRGRIPDFVERMMYLDLMTYLPDDGFVKVAKAARAAGIKVRSPIVDPEIIEFSKTLPVSMKIKNGKNKWILRRILHKYVPEEMIDRPKMGFGVPIDAWLRGPLRAWAEELLDEKEIKRDGILEPGVIGKLWKEHASGKRNNAYHLWDVLMFQSWKNRWM
ncbi:MAG: asparagine synthase (glutamine-hydrolyzing) [Candidatus Omnitrophica bacterium]|nr:asparagine synthase (glutamine-hydrolyzing) [Candidatus Omnitrophota bacterium]